MGISKTCASNCPPRYTEYVYSLRHPESMDLFYVGKTNNLKVRLLAHTTASESNKPKVEYIKNITGKGLMPIMGIVDFTDIRTRIDKLYAAHKELKWINHYKDIGWRLLNVSGVGVNLNSTDYTVFNRKESQRYLSDFYYGKDSEGNSIYNLVQLRDYGYELKEPEVDSYMLPCKQAYNPWMNERFLKMIGRDNPYDEITYDYKAYNDTDPNFYDEDYY